MNEQPQTLNPAAPEIQLAAPRLGRPGMSEAAEKLRKIARDAATLDEEAISVYRCVASAVKPMEGKKITKRFEAPVQKALPGTVSCYYMKQHGRYELIIRGEGLLHHRDYNSAMHFTLGVDSSNHYPDGGIFNFEAFEDWNACYGRAAEERNGKRYAWLDTQAPEELAAEILRLREQARKVEQLLDELPDRHAFREI